MGLFKDTDRKIQMFGNQPCAFSMHTHTHTYTRFLEPKQNYPTTPAEWLFQEHDPKQFHGLFGTKKAERGAASHLLGLTDPDGGWVTDMNFAGMWGGRNDCPPLLDTGVGPSSMFNGFKLNLI